MNNPLKQYFRRPAITVKLPSQGKFYPPDSIDMPMNGELPVYPMTAVDEITSKTPDALFNGTAIIELIKSCVPAIKDPWQIPSIDIDPLMIAIRSATVGNEMEIESQCPSCDTISKYGLNLVKLLGTLEPGNYDQTLTIDELEFKFKPLKYKSVNDTNMQQFDIQIEINRIAEITDETEKMRRSTETIKKLNMTTFKLVSENIEYIKTPQEIITNKDFVYEFLTNTDKKTFDRIRDHGVNLRKSSEIKPMKVKCTNCSHEFDQGLSLNVTDFFG